VKAVALALLVLTGRAAAQELPDDYGPLPADIDPPPSPWQDESAPRPKEGRAVALAPDGAASLSAQASAPAPEPTYAPTLQLAWRRLTIGRVGEATPSADSGMNGLLLEWYPYSRYLRFGVSTEYARESSDRADKDWYVAEHLSLGLQWPGFVTPFVEGSAGIGYLNRTEVGQTEPTAIWAFGADCGVNIHFSGRAYVTASVGWLHPVWLLINASAVVNRSAAGVMSGSSVLDQVYADSFVFKLGIGI
jgi:hypothetical protein